MIYIDHAEQMAFNLAALAFLTPDEIYESADSYLLAQLKEDRRLEHKPPGIPWRDLATYLSMWTNTSPEQGSVYSRHC